MVKSQFARKQVAKRIKKYIKEIKGYHYDGMLEYIGFGRNFKKDPWDCGNPRCVLCHDQGKGKSNPAKVQKEELNTQELIEEARLKLQAVREYQKDWKELGVDRVYKYYDDVDGNWLEEF